MEYRVRNAGQMTPIGIQVRGGAAHAVQLRRQNGRAVMEAAVSEPLEELGLGADPLSHALHRIMGRRLFQGKHAVAAIPAGEVEVRPLRLPPGVVPGGPGVDSILLAEARSCLLYDPAEAVLDYLPLPEAAADTGNRHMVLLIASRREKVHRFVAVLREAGLRCDHLEVAPCAVARILRQEQAFYAMVDLDERHAVISIAQGPCLRFSRTVKVGYREWVERLRTALDVSEDMALDLLREFGFEASTEARMNLDLIHETGSLGEGVLQAQLRDICGPGLNQLLAEVRRTIDYFALLPGGKRVERIFLLGQLLPRGIGPLLEDHLQTPVAPAKTLGECCGISGEAAQQWAAPIGLALRGSK